MNDAQGDIVRAQPLVEELFIRAQALEDRAMIARSYCQSAVIAFYQGDIQRMEHWMRQAVPLAQQYGTWHDQIGALNLLAASREHQEDYAEALHYFKEALRLAHQEGHGLFECLLLSNIGSIYALTEAISAAISAYQQALANAERLEFHIKAAPLIANLGSIAMLVGDYESARHRN